MKTVFSLPLVLLLLFSGSSYSQSLNKREITQLEAYAYRHYRELNFHDALPIYLKLDSIRPNNPKYQFPIGVSYLFFNEASKAIPFLEACKGKKEISTASLDYYLGKAYHLNAQFDKAIQAYTEYKTFFGDKNSKKHNKLYDDIDQEIKYCENGKELYNKPVKVRIVNLGPFINSEYPEYAPVISGDEREIILTSSRPKDSESQRDHSTDGHYYEDLYISTYNGKKWEPLQLMSDSVNTNDHDASVALSADGKNLILYRYTDTGIMDAGSGDLYISTLKDMKWSKAVKLPFCEKKYWEASATIANDGNSIIFSSNREGSLGGTDLYRVEKNAQGVWSIPVSMGNNINTPFDEDSPFLMPDGKTLYFSSKGHNSIGGHDIFVSTLSDETMMWSKPENIGYPLNTPHDDLHFSWSANGKRMYFASIRPEGFGDRDIYYAEMIETEQKKDSVSVNALLNASIQDARSQSSIPNASITVYELDNQGSTTSNIKQYKINSESNEQSIELTRGKAYLVIVEAEGYKTYTEKIDLTIPLEQELTLDKLFSMSKED